MVKSLEAEPYRIEAVFELSVISLLDQCVSVIRTYLRDAPRSLLPRSGTAALSDRRRHRAPLELQFGYCGIITTIAIVLTDFFMHTRHDRTLASIGNFLFLDVLLLGAVDMSNFVSI
ncbi:hypothetical protein [Nostoc sp. PCC 9305]|uniref:hypothetical protein n=1 Tax=Nostoc sp. PCC 9305 TaxID=296636 RepID=UPI0039C5AB66